MPHRFQQLTTIDELDQALLASYNGPIVIFKHSPTCGTSAMANEEMAELLNSGPVAAAFYMVRVQSARAVSDAIAARFGIRHESPQVLVIVDGQVCWHRSHFHVTSTNVLSAIASCPSNTNRVKLAATS